MEALDFNKDFLVGKNVRHIGTEYRSKLGSLATVIGYKSAKDVTVVFNDTGYVKTTRISELRNGSFKSPYCKSVFGIGYLGEGIYKVSEVGRITIAYDVWHSMLTRCYSKKYLETNPSYKGCTVHPDWHNFQVFAEWYYKHPFYGLGYQLDKDILCRGNKTYQDIFCTLVPREINTAVIDCKKARGNYPVGVTFHKRDNVFISKAIVDGKRKELGRFSTPKEAFAKYKKFKEIHLRQLAIKYKGKVEDSVFKSLFEWEIYCG